MESGGLLHAPRKRDLPNWLKENPDYEVEGDMLEVRSQPPTTVSQRTLQHNEERSRSVSVTVWRSGHPQEQLGLIDGGPQ